MKALIDGDHVAMAAAASAESFDEETAMQHTNEFVQSILAQIGGSDYEVWLSGDNNFRYSIYPEYKAHRKATPRPRWEQVCKQFLKDEWQANVSDGCEADDMLGVRQTNDTIICHLDKDLNMIPGWHFNWALKRNGIEIRPSVRYYVEEADAIKHFYYQLIVGDPVDNIKGKVRAGPKKAEALIGNVTDEIELFNIVRELYDNDAEFEMNASCLWLWRKEGDIWKLNTHDPTKRQG